jgi:hypothetical protein
VALNYGYSGIIDTVRGNSSESTEDLDSGKGVVDAGTDMTPHIPNLYALELDSQKPANRAERAKLSVLYQY